MKNWDGIMIKNEKTNKKLWEIRKVNSESFILNWIGYLFIKYNIKLNALITTKLIKL